MKNREILRVSKCSPTAIIHLAKSHEIPIYNFKIIAHDVVQFEINKKMHQNLLLMLQEKCYTIEVVGYDGLTKYRRMVFQKIGLLIGVLIAVVLAILIHNVTLYINIFGLETLSYQQVEETLASFGVTKWKVNNFNTYELEKYVVNHLEGVSMVSVMSRGNTITVNIKEKLDDRIKDYLPIYAPCNMLITNVSVLRGTSDVAVGDIVKKGSILVYPYYTNHDGEKIECEPIANIVGDTWFCGSVTWDENEVTYQRTGNVIVNKEVYFSDKLVNQTNKDNTFEFYETDIVESTVSQNLFLPIRIKSTYYYETKQVVNNRNFDDYQQDIKNQAKDKAMSLVPQGYIISEDNYVIKKIDSKYIVSNYLKSTVEVNNVNKLQ